VTVVKPKWVVLGVAVAGLGLLLQPQVAQELFMGGDNEYSLMTRLEAWGILWEIIKLNPILGVGPANYYFYTPLFNILGYSVSFNSHNNYVDIVAQTGLAGLACFLWFAWELGWIIWRLRNQMPDGFPRAYVYGALGGFVATLASGMLGDWVLPFVYNVGLEGFRASGLAWMFLGAVIALQQMYPPAEKSATT
jgi:O-antigen ligase